MEGKEVEGPRRIRTPFRDFTVRIVRDVGSVTGRGGVGHGARIFNTINAFLLPPFLSFRGGQCRDRIMHALFGDAALRCASLHAEIFPYDLPRWIGYLPRPGVLRCSAKSCIALWVPFPFAWGILCKL